MSFNWRPYIWLHIFQSLGNIPKLKRQIKAYQMIDLDVLTGIKEMMFTTKILNWKNDYKLTFQDIADLLGVDNMVYMRDQIKGYRKMQPWLKELLEAEIKQ